MTKRWPWEPALTVALARERAKGPPRSRAVAWRFATWLTILFFELIYLVFSHVQQHSQANAERALRDAQQRLEEVRQGQQP